MKPPKSMPLPFLVRRHSHTCAASARRHAATPAPNFRSDPTRSNTQAEKAKEEVQKVVQRLSELVHLPGHDRLEDYKLPLPHTYINAAELPINFNWQNINGTSYVTKSLNQHIPQVRAPDAQKHSNLESAACRPSTPASTALLPR